MAKINEKLKSLADRLKPTGMNHVFHFDVNGDDRWREAAIVKLVKDQKGTIVEVRWIDIALLDNIDKGRLKSLVTSVHANKYELWELMDMTVTTNGLNALTYFHQLVKITQGPGATNTTMGGGLAGVQAEGGAMPGAAFSDPSSGVLDSAPAN
jgi:hypothetical protein